MSEKITVGSIIGANLEEDFLAFDLTEIQEVLKNLREIEAIDLSHAEQLQQQALRGADILAEYLSRIIKTTSYFESKLNSVKNKVSLEYKDPDGLKTTSEMKKWAGESSPEVAVVNEHLSKAKATKSLLEKKYDILIKSHHHYKEISTGLKRSIVGYSNEKIPTGW